MLAGAVDAGKGFFVEQAYQTVALGHGLHQLHSQLVVVAGGIGIGIHRSQLMLSRAYHGSVGLLVNALAEQQQLSRSDIEELYAILRKAEEGTK